MKAIRFDRFGGPEVLHLVDMPDPVPGPREILVEVHAVSVVAGDCKLRNGDMAGELALRLPRIPGRDGAGIVRAVGDGVTRFKAGDRVCFTCQYGEQGTYAELAARPESDVARMPGRLNFIEAAAVTHAGICAYIAIVETAAVEAGDKVLVHAAAGAIGGIAVQLCRMLGAEVAGTCKARNLEHVKALGAHRAIAYDREDFSRAISGQDVVIDMIGGDVHTRSREVLRPGGRLVWLIAEPFESPDDGRDIDVRQALVKDSPETLAAVMGLADEGRVRPLISQVLPLYRAVEAHRIMEAGENTRGRLVLDTRRLAP